MSRSPLKTPRTLGAAGVSGAFIVAGFAAAQIAGLRR